MSDPTSGPVRVHDDALIRVITIDHPPANAISVAVIAALEEALAGAEGAPTCRGVVITGAGPRFFSAGADLNEIATEGEALRSGGLRLTRAMEESSLPVVAAVNGMALGGGCEVALAADIRVASTEARFAQPEINLGIMPGWGGTQRLTRLIGIGAALPLLLQGDPIGAGRALEVGLVSAVVAPDALLGAALKILRPLSQKAPLAVAAIKRAVRAGMDAPLPDGLEIEARELAQLLTSEDAVEGVTAFLLRRPAEWRGR